MKLHLCAGDIYLQGYTNIDITGKLVKNGVAHSTTLENYYFDRAIGRKKPTYIDKKMNILRFPWEFGDASVDEIVMIQAIEHFFIKDARLIIAEIHRLLKVGGRFLVDFPDIETTVREYMNLNPNFCMRFIYCNHKNRYSVHHWGYTRETFSQLLGEKWSICFRQIVKHDYPVIGCEATKL
jgi:predicted SAM-dependent methyltransferase